MTISAHNLYKELKKVRRCAPEANDNAQQG